MTYLDDAPLVHTQHLDTRGPAFVPYITKHEREQQTLDETGKRMNRIIFLSGREMVSFVGHLFRSIRRDLHIFLFFFFKVRPSSSCGRVYVARCGLSKVQLAACNGNLSDW